MDNILLVLEEMSAAATKMRKAIVYLEEYPGDPHGADDVDYSRDYVINTIARFNDLQGLTAGVVPEATP